MTIEYTTSSQEVYPPTDPHYPKLKPRFGRREALALLSFPTAMTLIACAGRIDAAEAYRMFLPLATNNYDNLKPTPTPEPTATPDTRPSYPWPAPIVEQLRQLPVLDKDRLRFGFYTNYAQIPYPDIKAIFTPQGGANADVPRRMVHLFTFQELTNMWVILTLGHEIFHHHQAWISMQNNPRLTIPFNYQQEYLNSPEGKEYVAASDAVVNEAHRQGMEDLSYLTPWEMPNFGVNTYEEAAGMGSIWYHQRSWLDRDILAPLKSWAREWLPKANLTPTPTSTPTPDTRPNSPWPTEMAQQLRELTVLDEDKLRFGYYTDRSQIPYPDIYAMFTGDGSGNADVPRRMVHVLATDRVQREWFVLIVGHERSHFHQAEMSRQIGMDPDSRPNFQQFYLNTVEGREFVAASNAAIDYARTHGVDMTSPFMHSPFGADDYEDTADVMSYWFNRRSALDGETWSQMRDWATKWLHR